MLPMLPVSTTVNATPRNTNERIVVHRNIAGKALHADRLPRRLSYQPSVGSAAAAMLSVRASTPLRPSEDPKKVERAMRTLFPGVELRQESDRFVLETDSLKSIRDLFWKNKILDAARRI